MDLGGWMPPTMYTILQHAYKTRAQEAAQAQQQQQQPGGSKLIYDRIPQDTGGKESPSYGQGKSPQAKRLGEQLTDAPAEDSTAQESSYPDPAQETSPATAPQSPTSPAQAAPQSQADPMLTLRKFALQTGLNLMAGGWGSPIQQIGQAIGGGAEAVQRSDAIARDKEKLKLDQAYRQRQELRQQQTADAATVRAGVAVENAKTARLKLKTKEKGKDDDLTAGMSPEAQSYFRHRMKTYKSELEPGPFGNSTAKPDPTQVFEQIMNETRIVDFRARAGRGQLKAEEVADAAINKVVQDPALEKQLFDQVRADPIQVGLLRTRLETARGQSNATR